MTSYGSLLGGPPSYDDSTLFDRGGSGQAASGSGQPGSRGVSGGRQPLKITITDPVKKVRTPL